MDRTIASVTPVTDASAIREMVRVQPAFAHLQDELVSRIVASECLLRGHFQLLSLVHTDIFLRFRSFVSKPGNLQWLSDSIATAIRQQGIRFDAVAAPDTAGSLLASGIAESFGKGDDFLLIETGINGRPTNRFIDARPRAGEKVLAVNDLVTSGEGGRAIIHTIEETGARVVGFALFATRAANPEVVLRSNGTPVTWMFSLDANQHGEAGSAMNRNQCPLCKEAGSDPIEARLLN